MDPISYTTATGWLGVVTGPFGGAFALGVVMGALGGIYLWQKYVVKPRIEEHVRTCEQRLDMLQKELDDVKQVADKWTRFMEREAMEYLKRDKQGSTSWCNCPDCTCRTLENLQLGRGPCTCRVGRGESESCAGACRGSAAAGENQSQG